MALIRANRESIDDRFSVLGFTVRTESPLFEVGLATDPALFKAENRARRTRGNFFTSRLLEAGRAKSDESIYLVPPNVVARFAGQPRLYFGLATYRDDDRHHPYILKVPDAGHMYINLSGLTERGLRRTFRGDGGNGYGTNGQALAWGGDALASDSAVNGNGNAAVVGTKAGNGIGAGNGLDAQASAPYSDGYPDELWQQDAAAAPKAVNGEQAAAGAVVASDSTPVLPAAAGPAQAAISATQSHDDGDGHGIDSPIPDTAIAAAAHGLHALGRPLATPTPEYPQASRFAPAAQGNYRASRSQRDIKRVVIHITDGGPNISGPVSWFQNPDANVSAHYVIGQDGEVVQMVRHNDIAWHARSANADSIGIEHVANTRGLVPTPAQMAASAALVTWLCDRYAIPQDRTHILGHSEADPATTHTGCPNSVWDWDYYMGMVASRTSRAPEAATSQSLGANRRHGTARAMELITPFYDPADPATALSCQADAFSLAREEWFAGVPNTRIFPHSAICQLLMTASNGDRFAGTGFYIGRNRILTCAHNLHGMSSVEIIPGRNGATGQPFGSATVAASSWRVAPGYTGSGDYDDDLAVIDDVPIEAPSGNFFSFLNATPSDRLPIVVCGYSSSSRVVPALNEIIDGDMQHLHGGYARAQASPDTIDYPILTLRGASGSPVYHLSDAGGELQALICAVHVSSEPAEHGLNRGCFITPAKIDWIEGRARSFALGAPLRADSGVTGTARRGKRKVQLHSRAQGVLDVLPVDLKLRVFIPAPVVLVTIPGIGGALPFQSAHGGDGRGFGFDGGSSRAEITARLHFGDDENATRLTDVQRRFGESLDYDREDTVAVPGKPEWYRALRPGAAPVQRATQQVTDDRLKVALGGGSLTDAVRSMGDNSVAVTFEVHASNPAVTASPDIDATLGVVVKVDGERIKVRVHGGHDEFPAFELYANGVLVYSYDPVAAEGTPWGLTGPGAWDVNPDTDYVDAGPASEYRLIGPVRIGGAGVKAQGIPLYPGVAMPATGKVATAGPVPSTEPPPAVPKAEAPPGLPASGEVDYPVTLIAQPDKTGSWSAAAAMLLSWRRGQPITPAAVLEQLGEAATADDNELLEAMKQRFGLLEIAPTADAGPRTRFFHKPRQWADWLGQHGALWVLIVGEPHAVVVAGIRGDLADPASVLLKVLNPWDTRVAFDADPAAFHPANRGYEDWLSFADFIDAFGNLAEPDYGDWRVLYLPAQGAAAQSLAAGSKTHAPSRNPDAFRLAPPPAPIAHGMVARALDGGATVAIASVIAGAAMERLVNNDGDITWELDQLRGYKHPNDTAPSPMPASNDGRTIRLDDWPSVENKLSDEISAGFEINWQYNGKSLGNVMISSIATNDAVGWGLSVKAKIMDDNIVYPRANPTHAALRIRFEYRFTRAIGSDKIAIRDVHLFGDGSYAIDGRWEQ